MSQRHDRDALRRMLVASAGHSLEIDRGEVATAAAAMTASVWTRLPAAADFHGVGLNVASALRTLDDQADVPEDVAADIRGRSLAHAGHRLRTSAALSQVAPMLDSCAPGWTLLKGAVLAEYVYREPALRTFSDIDVLIAPADLRATLAALEDVGASLVSRNWHYLEALDRKEVQVTLPQGVALDLHWGLLAEPRQAPALRLRTADLLARASPVTLLEPVEVLTRRLSDTDQFIHVCVHAVLNGISSLRACLDIDQSARRLDDVDEVVARVEETNARLPVAVALLRASRALSVEAEHSGLLHGVLPHRSRGWLSAMRINDKLNPATRAHEPYPWRFLAASTRSTTGSSLSALVHFSHGRMSTVRSWSDMSERLRDGAQVGLQADESLQPVSDAARDRFLGQLESDLR